MIWKNKSLFLLLFILQILFFAASFFVTYKYMPKIVGSAKSIALYLDEQKLDEASVASNILNQKSILGDDPLSISRNFNEIVRNFRIYFIYIFLLLAVFGSTAWTMTNKIIRKTNLKQLIKIFLKTSVVLLFYLGLIFSFFFSLLNIPLIEVAAEASKLYTKYIPFLFFSAVLSYFMLVSLSLLHGTELRNIVQKTLAIGIKKFHYVLSAYFVNALLFVMSAILLIYFRENSLLILLISVMLIIFSFVFGRIFLVNVVGKLEKI